MDEPIETIDAATSGRMRCRYKIQGGHVHCLIFGPFAGKSGELVFNLHEWDHFKSTHPTWFFINEFGGAVTNPTPILTAAELDKILEQSNNGDFELEEYLEQWTAEALRDDR